MRKIMCIIVVLTVLFSGCIGSQSGSLPGESGVNAPSGSEPTTTLEETTTQNKHLISPIVTTTITSTLTTSIPETSSMNTGMPQK